MEKIAKLTSKQLKMITNILSSPSVEKACKKSKISRATYYKWLENEIFKSLLEEKRKEIVKEAFDKLKLSVNIAVDVLVGLMKSKNETTRRQAAEDVLDYTIKATEIESIESRLEKIEQRIGR